MGAFTATAAEIEPPPLLAREVLEDSAFTASLTANEEAPVQMIRRLQAALVRSASREDRLAIRAALVCLGDEETIIRVLSGFAASKSALERGQAVETFNLANAAFTIPRLVDFVFLDDRLEHLAKDLRNTTRKSFVSARLVLDLLARCPSFSARTREAAHRMGTLTDRQIRDRLRQWWPKNAEHFSRRDYRAVSAP